MCTGFFLFFFLFFFLLTLHISFIEMRMFLAAKSRWIKLLDDRYTIALAICRE